MAPSIVVSDLTFSWPDGRELLNALNLVLGPGRTGLVGGNGSGKSTLLRLIAGPAAGGLPAPTGSVRVTGDLAYLPQDLVLDATARVENVLGVAPIRAALAAVERGDATAERLAVIGDDWDIEERSRAVLDRLGLAGVHLDRRVGELSGGEAVLLGLAARFLRRPGVLLLDEPTNNLDLAARHRLYDAVVAFNGVLVVVSHDRELLGLVDQVAELRDGAVTCYGGAFTDYEEAVEAELRATRRTVRAAESDVRRQRRELEQARIVLDRRARYGRKMAATKREPKIVMGERKRQAQVSAGKHRGLHEARLQDAREKLTAAEDLVRDEAEIRVDLPDTRVPAGRDVLTVTGAVLRCGARIDLSVRGPERIALTGGNGSGKTTLLRTVAGLLAPRAGEVRLHVPARYLPQRLDLLDDTRTLAQNVAALAPGADDNTVRAKLARFLFRGDRVTQLAGTLSGGERLRATLAALVLAEPAPQLLMLDEPTNNLDLPGVRQLVGALESYQGALIVASHDLPLLRDLRIQRWLALAGDGLTEIDPL